MEWPRELEELQGEACSLKRNPRMGDLLGSSPLQLWDKTVRLTAKEDNSSSGYSPIVTETMMEGFLSA